MEEKGINVGNASFPMTVYTPDQRKQIIAVLIEAGLEI